MVKELEHKELRTILMAAKERKVSMILLGRTGIGKSDTIKNAAKDMATSRNKEFLEWNECTMEQKKEVITNPDKYFGFLDIRLTQYEPSDIKGLPSFQEGTVVWQQNLWVKAFQAIDGVILFDEINLCPPLLQNSVYQIILDKQVGESPLNKDVMIVGAGNLQEDRASTFEIPKPIISRGMIFELRCPSAESWTDWALAHDIDSRVVSYIQFAGHNLFHEKDDETNIITPRGWEFVSSMIKGVPDMDKVELLSSGILGEAGALEFRAFVELTNKWDIDYILKNPKDAELPTEIDQTYSLVSAISEKYKGNKKYLKPIFKILPRLKPDFAILLLRFIKGADVEYFTKELPDIKEWAQIATKYKKYIS